MKEVKMIAALSGSAPIEKAVVLSEAGADALYYKMETEGELELIKQIARAVDTPVYVRTCPKRFEDVKKVLYAGASKAYVVCEDADVMKEVLDRFGTEKIVKVDSDIVVCEVNKATDLTVLAEQVKAQEAADFFLDLEDGNLMNEVKVAFAKSGLDVNTFESSIPFSEFKLNGDGLIPVVVQDYKTSDVLMVAYMNEESYNKTVETGRMTYFSRSRNELWIKGETSGHYQYVKSMSIDCDKDTILAKVAQIGAACHTGNPTCFFTDLVKKEYNDVNPLKVLMEEYSIIMNRKENPKEGSYTNYLFDKGVDKILKKVGEEATEIVIAAKNPDAEELKYEICDFLYHMMVLMAECNVTWDDITKELVERR